MWGEGLRGDFSMRSSKRVESFALRSRSRDETRARYSMVFRGNKFNQNYPSFCRTRTGAIEIRSDIHPLLQKMGPLLLQPLKNS